MVTPPPPPQEPKIVQIAGDGNPRGILYGLDEDGNLWTKWHTAEDQCHWRLKIAHTIPKNLGD